MVLLTSSTHITYVVVAASAVSMMMNDNALVWTRNDGIYNSYFVEAFQTIPTMMPPLSSSSQQQQQRMLLLLTGKSRSIKTQSRNSSGSGGGHANQHDQPTTGIQRIITQPNLGGFILHSSSSSNNGSRPGMEDAFRQLEEMTSHDSNNNNNSDGVRQDLSSSSSSDKIKDEAFALAMKELNLKDIMVGAESSTVPPTTLESEIELYKDMVSEISSMGGSEEGLIASFKSDLAILGGDGEDEDVLRRPVVDANPSSSSLSSSTSSTATEKFMDLAFDEALKEAREKGGETLLSKESLLDNKEIMNEIEVIFDKANAELLKGLEEIRMEQMALAQQQADRNARATQQKMDDDEKRMAVAEANMERLLSKVNAETKNVERAIEELKQAQEDAQGGIDGKLSNLKTGGFSKQAALAGTMLFTLRSGIEVIASVGGDPTHIVPAIIQGGLAIVCLAAFLFL